MTRKQDRRKTTLDRFIEQRGEHEAETSSAVSKPPSCAADVPLAGEGVFTCALLRPLPNVVVVRPWPTVRRVPGPTSYYLVRHGVEAKEQPGVLAHDVPIGNLRTPPPDPLESNQPTRRASR